MNARILTLVAFVSWSCGSAEQRATGSMFTDSAGIEIVLNDASVVSQAITGTVTSAPEFDPRGPAPALEFYQVQGLVALDSGFGVINSGTRQLRVFDDDGTYQRSIGARGGGPGEFHSLGSVYRYRGDSLLMRDSRTQVITIFDQAGTPDRSLWLAIDDYGRAPSLLAVLPSGHLLAYARAHLATVVGQGTIVDSSQFAVYDPECEVLTNLGRWPTGARVRFLREGVFTTLEAPFAVSATGTSWQDGFCLWYGARFEIRCHDGVGVLRRILRVAMPGEPMTPASIGRYEEQQSRVPYAAYRNAWRRIRDDIVYPDTVPVFERVVGSEEGGFWVEAYRPFGEGPNVWWYLDPDGHFVGAAELPPRFVAYLFDGEIIRGVWRDEFDVEHVRTLRVEWPNPSE